VATTSTERPTVFASNPAQTADILEYWYEWKW
jgi:hypothetical protein